MHPAARTLLVSLALVLANAVLVGLYVSCPCCWPLSGRAACSPPCPAPPCVPKCCPAGHHFYNGSCQDAGDAGDQLNLTDLPLWVNGELITDRAHENYKKYQVVNSARCESEVRKSLMALRPDGDVQDVDYQRTLKFHEYCVEYFPGNGTLVLECFPELPEQPSDLQLAVYPYMLAGGVPFLVATAFVYLLLPELHNLHGKALICHNICLATASVVLAMIQMNAFDMNIAEPKLCFISAFIAQFTLLATFFWMNIMCFDIWLKFCGLNSADPLRGSDRKRDQKRFLMYSVYAWGGPMIILAVTLVMDLVPFIPNSMIKPRVGVANCWFLEMKAMVLYFYLPIAVLLLLNIVMFVMIAKRLRAHSRDTEVLHRPENRRNNDSDRQRLSLYFKLFIVMGINWVMELVSFCVGGSRDLWFVTDLGNTLQGLLIFVVFVCKRRILWLLNKRLCPGIELVAPSSQGSTRSKVSSASRTTSSTTLSRTVSNNPDSANQPRSPVVEEAHQTKVTQTTKFTLTSNN